MLDYNYFYDIIQCIGCLAQLVEQVTFNHWVTGSSPVTPTNSKKVFRNYSKKVERWQKMGHFFYFCDFDISHF